jgi:hypothetical protein
MAEFSRILKPGGYCIITTPFTSGSHQEPFHYYSGYSRYFFEFAAECNGLGVIEITPHGGFFRLMAQELARLAGLLYTPKVGASSLAETQMLLGLAERLMELPENSNTKSFTIGYWTVLRKKFE